MARAGKEDVPGAWDYVKGTLRLFLRIQASDDSYSMITPFREQSKCAGDTGSIKKRVGSLFSFLCAHTKPPTRRTKTEFKFTESEITKAKTQLNSQRFPSVYQL